MGDGVCDSDHRGVPYLGDFRIFMLIEAHMVRNKKKKNINISAKFQVSISILIFAEQ